MKNPTKIEELDPDKTETWEYLTQLATVVQQKHYPGHEEAEDLRSEALIKAIDMITNKEHPQIRSLRSYLYTGMRNTMSNYLYHRNKITPLDDLEIPHTDTEPALVNPEEIVRALAPIASERTQGIVLVTLQRLLQGEQIEDITPPDMNRETERALVVAIHRLIKQVRG